MPNPPLTSKAIPQSIAGWRAEVEGIRRLLEGLSKYRRDMGSDWVKNTRLYYKARLDDLLDNAPPSLVRSGEARQARSK